MSQVLRLLFKHETIALAPNAFNSDSSAATVILKMICQSLVRIDHDGEIAPELALRWEVSPCRKRYTFDLDDRVRFHSGRPFTADDVVRVFGQIFDRKSDSVLAADYEGLESVKAQGAHRVVFDFSTPNDAFLNNLAWRTHIVDDTVAQPCGTGAFRLTEWVRGSHIKLERHIDGRGRGDANVDEVEIRYAPDVNQRVALIESGAADIVESVPGSAAQRLEEAGLLHTMAAPSQARVLLCFNCQEAPFNDVRVRHAVACAVDRSALIRDVMGGQARSGEGVLPHDDPWAHPVEPVAYDPEKARMLLREAGYENGLTIKVVHPTTAPLPAISARVAQDLEAVGIRLEASSYDDPPWWPYMYMQGNWQMAIQGTASRPHFDTLLQREFCSDGVFNAGRYSNDELDVLAYRARHSTDNEERRELYARIQEIIRAELPVMALFSANVLVGWAPHVSGFKAHPHGVVDIQNVRMAASVGAMA